ncbi:MAG: pilus assembly protein PilM, partial [Kiritimatiellaeota bacterium]|nr:pilus assembly protein PilM [Kiritimatiellota bacterium]
MFASNRILALNVGASKIALAEFTIKGGKAPVMMNYGMLDLDLSMEGGGSGERLSNAIRELMRMRGIRPAPILVALSGQVVFPRFVKLPAVARDKLMQMVQYEVEQNVPFPLNEIVWDHQFIGDDASGEQSVMIVAAKAESVREITGSVAAAGFEPEIVDVAPMAICNALRFNHAGLDGCTLVLDIGARSTNLVFLEDGRIYSRCVSNMAGNAITQELAKSLGITAEEAEALKCERGFVSLGGVHQSEDAETENISRVIRNVMTRIHAEISRSVNFYRSQQGGTAPSRLILTGGTSLLPHLDLFFKEKLGVEVEYLNPFVNVPFGSRMKREQLGVDAFMLSEVVGLALRRSLACPVEINLMPPELVKQKTLRRRLPFFGLAAVGVLLSLGIWTLYAYRMADLYSAQLEKVEARRSQMDQMQKKLDVAVKAKTEVEQPTDAV